MRPPQSKLLALMILFEILGIMAMWIYIWTTAKGN